MERNKPLEMLAHPKGFEPLTPRFVVSVNPLKYLVSVPALQAGGQS